MFIEAFAIVTISSYFLSKHEVKLFAKGLGAIVGRTVGTLQGLRIQMDDQSRKNSMFKLHGSIRTGLQSVRSIGYDIASIASSNPRSSILNSRNTSNQQQATMNDHSMIPSNHNISSNKPIISGSNSYSEEIDRLARLAIVEQELSNMTSQPRRGDVTGADIVMDTLTDSIIARSYAQQLSSFKAENQVGSNKEEK